MNEEPSSTVSLTPIAVEEISPAQAQELIGHRLRDDPQDGDSVYRALRAWTWRSLTERRFDQELRGWWELMRTTSAWLRHADQAECAERVSALTDLVYESIQVAEHETVEAILDRVHVRQALRAASSGWRPRQELRDQLGLKEANLSRLLALLQARGLMEKRQRGRLAFFRATQTARERLAPASLSETLGGGYGVTDLIARGGTTLLEGVNLQRRADQDTPSHIASGRGTAKRDPGGSSAADPRVVRGKSFELPPS